MKQASAAAVLFASALWAAEGSGLHSYLLASFPTLQQVNYATLPDEPLVESSSNATALAWRPLVGSTPVAA